MNSISLAQLSIFVIAVSMASFFVNADDSFVNSTEDNAIVAESTVVTESAVITETTEAVEEAKDNFTFTSLDSDKNGKLSQQEVLNGKNVWLVKSFKAIDSNKDESITEQELVNFVAKTKSVSQ
jgi:Ca2+-binding EF-hand superfamily protein